MGKFITGLIVGLAITGVWAAEKTYTVEPFSGDLTPAEVVACINAGGEGAVLYDLELADNEYGYTATSTGYACITEVK